MQGQRPMFVRPVGPGAPIVAAAPAATAPAAGGGRWPTAQGNSATRSVQVRASGMTAGTATTASPPLQLQAAPSPHFPGAGAYDAAQNELQEDRDINSLRSPGGSLVSSVTTLPCGGVVDSAAGLGRWGGVNMQEALATMEVLAIRVNESLEQMPSRLAEATSEVRADTTALRAEIQAMKEDLTSQLGEGLSAERDQRQELLQEVHSLGHDLRDQLNQEVERLRDSVMREMRERMDGQKVLREEVQLQQGSLMRLTSRVEDSFVELRTEIPRLGQEQTAVRDDLQRLQEVVGMNGHAGLQARLDQCEKMLKEQRELQMATESGFRQEMKEVTAAKDFMELKKMVSDQNAGLQKAADDGLQTTRMLEEQKEAIRSLQEQHVSGSAALKESIEQADQIFRQLLEATESKQREALEGLHRRLEEVRQCLESSNHEVQTTLGMQFKTETTDVKSQLQMKLEGVEQAVRQWTETRLSESESSSQAWVEASVVNRINALDKAVKKEMAERTSTNEQILGMITHNSERWCQLQAKFDEILVYIQKGTSPGDFAGGDGSTTFGRSLEDR
ncbi:unnamed protein product [Durusdinium trenchii]|uniref:Uncharacterized protein n=2 Tax=Durusdinium trenchii TaxID=1381693 RepID=A0ABP0MQX2_9DINO